MCGIVGFTNNISYPDEVLGKMMDRIKHRGPDAYGKYIDAFFIRKCTDTFMHPKMH